MIAPDNNIAGNGALVFNGSVECAAGVDQDRAIRRISGKGGSVINLDRSNDITTNFYGITADG